ncbi:amidohydrolase family protein [Saccharomonospora sp. NPDC006951]
MLDVHTHFVPRNLPPPDDEAAGKGWPVLRERGALVDVIQRGAVVRTLTAGAWEAGARVADMDRLGVARQVVMPAPFTFLYDAGEYVATRYATEQNDVLAELVAAAPGRLLGLGTLPLAHPSAALAEIRRIAAAPGLAGVVIGTHAGALQLHDAALDPVFAAIERHDLAVFVHPWQPLAAGRTAHHGLAFGLGRPVETELAVGSLVFGGVLDRHPGLRVCLAHGGAGIPSLRGRLRNGWLRRAPADRVPAIDPLEALRGLWADGLTYDGMALALAEDTFGADKMVLGTDYPFAAQESKPGASFDSAAARSPLAGGTEWHRRTHRNALAFLGLRPEPGHDTLEASQ